jgi:deazaflavin-dependent oxidoreductase (nitroreductase family)
MGADQQPSAARHMARALARRPLFRRLGRRVVPGVDRVLHRLTGGRVQLGSLAVPMLVLTVRGRRSGEPRQTSLAYVPDGDHYLVVGSNWGQERHPVWTTNLLAADRATVNVRGWEVEVRPVLLEGDERDVVWGRLLEVWPVYADYEQLSGRTLRVFRLGPADG